MVLSELTNKELMGILRENDVRNYSKLNKKGLLKKVNQLIKEQNGGSKKKYRLRGGSPLKKGNQGDTTPATAVNYDILNNNTNEKDSIATATANAPGTPANAANAAPAPGANGPTPPNTPGAPAAQVNSPEATAPLLENKKTQTNTKKDPLMVYSANPTNKNYKGKAEGLTPIQYGNIKPNNSSTNNKNTTDACGSCSIL